MPGETLRAESAGTHTGNGGTGKAINASPPGDSLHFHTDQVMVI